MDHHNLTKEFSLKNDSKGVLRNARPDDLPAMLEIYNEVILNTTSVYSEKPHTLEMRQAWYKDRMESGFPIFVAEVDGKIAGFSSFGHFRVWPCYRYTVEHSVYVDVKYRGMGVSKLLLQLVIDRAREMGLHAMIAGIDSLNTISYDLHLKFGFTEVAHFKEVGFKFGKWLDLKFMELILD